MNNYYSALGLDPKASAEEIKKAYRALAQKYHPDAGDPQSVGKFHQVTAAYKCLSDPDQRREYDAQLEEKGSVPPSSEEAGAPSSPAVHTNLYRERISPEREKELRQFYRKRFLKGMFKVMVMVALFFAIGFGLAWLLKGYRIMGGILFALAGVFLGIGRNFELESFISTARGRRNFKRASWIVYVLTFAYAVYLSLAKINF